MHASQAMFLTAIYDKWKTLLRNCPIFIILMMVKDSPHSFISVRYTSLNFSHSFNQKKLIPPFFPLYRKRKTNTETVFWILLYSLFSILLLFLIFKNSSLSSVVVRLFSFSLKYHFILNIFDDINNTHIFIRHEMKKK